MTGFDWHALFDCSPPALVVTNLSGRILVANTGWLELFGVQGAALNGLTAFSFVHPDDRDAHAELHHALLDGSGDAFDCRQRFVRVDGSIFVGRVRGVRLDGPAGSDVLLSSVDDVTDEDAERHALEQEIRVAALVRSTTNVLAVVDAQMRLTYVSPAVEPLLGYTSEELTGQSALEHVHADDVEAAANQLREQVSVGGLNLPLLLRLVHRDGRPVTVEATSVNMLQDPTVNGVVITLHPLVGMETASLAQDILRRRYLRMLELLAHGVALLDRDGTVLEILGPERRLGSHSPTAWTPRETIDRCHPDDRARLIEEFTELFSSAGNHLCDRFRFEDAAGDWMTLELEGLNLTDNPDLAGTVVAIRDVTESERATVELAEARDQALRALDARSEFVATASHELRTPIHGILGLSELLLESDDPEVRRVSGAINRATESLRLVVDDILDLSKLEAGRLEVVGGPIDLLELRDDLMTLFGPQADARHVRFAIELEPGFPEWAWGDGLRVRQVLTNLIGNSLKFTNEGHVRVYVSREPAPPEAGWEELVRVEVRDTGIGIAESAQAGLFAPFSQAHATTAHRYGGTGLGLVISRKLTELLGGQLSFCSTEGRGSTFWVVLPLVPLKQEGPERQRENPGQEITTTRDTDRILVVEDNPVNQLLVERQLEALGFSSDVVGDGESALTSFSTERPRAVLLDLRLPGIDGLETAIQMRQLEARRSWERTPIIAMTASALAGDRGRCAAVGMDDFLAKPVGLPALRSTMTKWCAVGTPVQSVHAPAVIDARVPDQLADELDDPALVAHLCEMFLRELPSRTGAITNTLRLGDGDLRASAHALRSAALTLGATGLVEWCAELESRGPDDPLPDLSELASLADATAVQLQALADRYRSAQTPR